MLVIIKSEKFLKILILIGLIFLVIIIFAQKVNFTNIDLGRHLENGKIVWQNPAVLFTNFYSYTEPNLPFINHHWLSGVILYGVYLLGGFSLLSIFNIILALGTFLLAFNLARQKANFYLSALISIPVIFLLSERVEIRPEILSYLFIFIVWTVIYKTNQDQKWRRLWYLVPIFILWANLHIYFFIGLALLGFQVLAEVLPILIKNSSHFLSRLNQAYLGSRPWLFAFVASTLACLINPNTWRGLLYPFNIFQNYGYEIAENKSIFYLEHLIINPNFLLFKVLIFILIASIVLNYFFTKKIQIFDLLVALFFSFLAIFASRNLALFALVTLVLIPANLKTFNYLLVKKNIKLYLAIFLLLALLVSGSYLLIKNYSNQTLGLNLAQGSEDSLTFYKNNNLSGPIFNNYDLGSALIFWLFPQDQVFVDNRPEAYSEHFISDVYKPLQSETVKWTELSNIYQFKTIYFSYSDSTPWAQQFLSRITSDANWALVYFDRYSVILLNKKLYPEVVIKNLSLDETTVVTRLRSLATNSNSNSKLSLAAFAQKVKQSEIAREIYQQIIFNNPNNNQAIVSMGYLFTNSSHRTDQLKAIKYLQQAQANGYRLPDLDNQIGLVYWQLEEYQKAEAAWNSALKLERKNISALYYLNQISDLKKAGKLPLTWPTK